MLYSSNQELMPDRQSFSNVRTKRAILLLRRWQGENPTNHKFEHPTPIHDCSMPPLTAPTLRFALDEARLALGTLSIGFSDHQTIVQK